MVNHYPHIEFRVLRILWFNRSDNDQYSHVNNAIYYQLFDSIINAFLISEGILAPNLDRDSTPRPIGLVVSSYCQYFAPLSYPQTLDLGLRVNKIGKSSVEYEVGVFAQDDEAVAAVGGYTHVFVDSRTRKALPSGITKDMRQSFEKLYKETQPDLGARSKL